MSGSTKHTHFWVLGDDNTWWNDMSYYNIWEKENIFFSEAPESCSVQSNDATERTRAASNKHSNTHEKQSSLTAPVNCSVSLCHLCRYFQIYILLIKQSYLASLCSVSTLHILLCFSPFGLKVRCPVCDSLHARRGGEARETMLKFWQEENDMVALLPVCCLPHFSWHGSNAIRGSEATSQGQVKRNQHFKIRFKLDIR